jgi:hypothetical protein
LPIAVHDASETSNTILLHRHPWRESLAHQPETVTAVSRFWIQAAIIVFLIGFLILGLLAYRAYTGKPPIPGRVIDPNGNVLFMRAQPVDATPSRLDVRSKGGVYDRRETCKAF